MDRFTLEHNLRDAYARLLASHQNLLSQRAQVRELERYGLDTSAASALLQTYEETNAMAVFNRDCLSNALKAATFMASTATDPSIDNYNPYADFEHRLAA